MPGTNTESRREEVFTKNDSQYLFVPEPVANYRRSRPRDDDRGVDFHGRSMVFYLVPGLLHLLKGIAQRAQVNLT